MKKFIDYCLIKPVVDGVLKEGCSGNSCSSFTDLFCRSDDMYNIL